MHVQANMTAYQLSDNILTRAVIPWFTNFTFLFMIVSAFSMCCGYYERVKNGAIAPAQFYAKRYHRAWPFFAMMVLISFALEPSWSTFCQTFANLTLCFNLLPNPHIEIIGVGWFLGTVFTFYMLFPFVTFLMNNKRRGWMVLTLSLAFCFIASTYFSTPDMVVKPIDRVNIIYSAPFFLVGCMVYLYRTGIKRWTEKYGWVALTVCIALTTMKFVIPSKELKILPDLLVFTAWLMYALGSKDRVLNNKTVKYLSGISMEVYLCHMMFYRVACMLHLEKWTGDNNVLYVANCIVTIAGAVCFSHMVKYKVFPALDKVMSRYRETKNNRNESIISE